MLHVFTVDSVLGSAREAFREEFFQQIGSARAKVLRFYKDRLAYWEWDRRKVFLVEPNLHSDEKTSLLYLEFIQELASGFRKSSVKDIWTVSNTDVQLWVIDRFNEKILRDIRKLEQDGLIEYHCFMLHNSTPFTQTEKEEAYPELKRVIKSSQNGRIDVSWIEWDKVDIMAMIMRDYGTVYSVPKETSAYENPNTETPLSQLMRQYYSDTKGREINWYPKKYVHKVMDEEKWGVEKLPKKEQGKVKRHVLVTGTGRSGTTYFSDLLTMLGLDVGHQRNGNDGCSGAEFAIDHDWYPWFPVYGGGDCANVGERRSDYTYKHVLHIVRHPLWCIPSLMKNYPAINPEFWADSGAMDPKVMDSSSLFRNANMYYAINQTIDESGQAEYRCQLEQVHEHWGALMSILEMDGTPNPSLKASNQASGWGQYEPLTWEQLEAGVGSALAKSIRMMAKDYGYE